MSRANVLRIPTFNPIADDLQAAIDMFTSTCRSKNLSAKTVEYYGCKLRAFQRHLDSNADTTAPKDLTTRAIRDFLIHESENNSATTASHSYITRCGCYC